MNNITFTQIKNKLYQEGFHILISSDSQIKRLSGFSPMYCQGENSIKGVIIPDRNEIIINKNLDIKERVLTLIHELIHLLNPRFSENQTEAQTFQIYDTLNDSTLGFLEFAVSHSS